MGGEWKGGGIVALAVPHTRQRQSRLCSPTIPCRSLRMGRAGSSSARRRPIPTGMQTMEQTRGGRQAGRRSKRESAEPGHGNDK